MLGLFVMAGSPPKAYADETDPAFRIGNVKAEYGHIVVEVSHLNPDGTHRYWENYVIRGKEWFKKPRVTDSEGRLLLDTGEVAPYLFNDFGELRQSLPDGKDWKYQELPFLEFESFTLAATTKHIERENIVWEKGTKRLITYPLDFVNVDPQEDSDESYYSQSDMDGAQALLPLFTPYIGKAYSIVDGKAQSYLDPLPEIDMSIGFEYGTVAIIYPDDGDGNDGWVGRRITGAGESWSAVRTGTGNYGASDSDAINYNTLATGGGTNLWSRIDRSIYLFDTDALGSGATISSAVLGLVYISLGDTLGISSPGVTVVSLTPGDPSDIAQSDYQTFATTKFATLLNSALTIDSSTYNDFTLDTNGRNNIDPTGISNFGTRWVSDNDNVTPTWAYDKSMQLSAASADETVAGDKRPKLTITYTAPSAAVTGTIGDNATEQEVRDGGGTIILTLTDTTWGADGGTWDAHRQNIIDGLDAADAQTNGWNAQVRDQLGVTSVVRTSDTIATVTVSASDVEDYRIDTNETITATVPSTAIAAAGALTATPTFTITAGAEAVALTGTVADGATPAEIEAGGQTAILTLTNTKWVASGSTFNAQRQNIIDGFVSASSDTNGWNNRRSDFAVTDVVRTSDTIVTITFSASSAYSIPSAETVTVTVPASAMVLGSSLVAAPTFAITPTFTSSGTWVSPAINLSSILEVAYCAIGWDVTTPTSTSATVEYSSDGGGTYSTPTNGQCPFSIGSGLSTITDFRLKVSLATTDSGVSPTVNALGLVVGTTTGQTLRYQLNTTPALTITDRTGNGYSGTFSFPAQPDGVETTVGAMTALTPASAARPRIGVAQVTSPVTGVAVSDNLFNLDETGWAELPGYGLVNTMATAGDGLPAQFIWYIFLGFVTIMLGFFALNLTQSLFAAGAAMALGIAASIAIGGGLMPGWTIFVFLPIAIGLVLLRPRLAI